MEPAPFPNRLRSLDLSRNILVYMAQRLHFRLADVIHLVTSNTPSSAMAVYVMLERRMARYRNRQTTENNQTKSTDDELSVSSAKKLTYVCVSWEVRFHVTPNQLLECPRQDTVQRGGVVMTPDFQSSNMGSTPGASIGNRHLFVNTPVVITRSSPQ